ncbi:TRAP transporter small permease [Sulfitobacter guttiformis]|uniref:TRAP transporter small permease protein n=1 Tax=Sulfitobacter guttiformis TaxID=74349 RepID=A0A420DTY0_9RHOB|nr:TRAP transporter small permease [Sulfitobacter guttiformis]KIN71226.1 TRAP transporter, subunit DctQ [Sulfitobacter guttiformis KCTC 32187]RKE97695.1 TRAP-type C4-dicarboxylate transport system permease small subunit [Sulfitobacter guttiformis]
MYLFFLKLSRLMAYLGGAMLSFLIIMTCISIVGRSLNGALHSDMIMSVAPDLARWLLDLGIGPVNGDFELVEAGVAFSIFAFLPLCQITGGHASVDIFTARLSERVNRVLQMLIDLLFAAVLVLIAVQLFSGMQSKLGSGQTSLLLQYPVWWGYALCLSGATIAAAVSTYIAVMRLAGVTTGQDLLPQMAGADH